MMAKAQEATVRERLVQEGWQELNRSGIQNFSVRRVATACGVSCAAPYKHFKDKQSYIAAIIQYVRGLWRERQEQALEGFVPATKEQLVALAVEYVRFLVENPYFRSAIMLTDEAFDQEYLTLRGQLSRHSRELISQYCVKVNLPDAIAKFKIYIVMSLIYGAALMFDNGEMHYTESNLSLVAQVIEREFDLP